jgi:ankyrin repeat protein
VPPLCSYVDEDGRSAFFVACIESQIRAARLLMKAGADPQQRDRDGGTPLWAAAHAGELAVVQFLVEQVHVDATTGTVNGATPLHAAAHQGQVEIVQFLLEKGGGQL